MSSGSIIVGGAHYPCLIPVHHWMDSGLWFGIKPLRVHQTRLVILHWTGAENSAADVVRNMQNHVNRKTSKPEPLSVHFVVDQQGDIYQCMDTQARGAHCAAGGGNVFGVGVEICNRGHDFSRPTKGFIRPRRTELVHGSRVTYGDFFYAQTVAVVALCHAICAASGIPVQVPRGPDWDVVAWALSRDELYRFHGVIGHYCAEPGKPDPGPELLRKIAAAGAKPSRPPPVA